MGTSLVAGSSEKTISDRAQQISLPCGFHTRVFDSGGDKPVVVLVHGLANALDIWEPIVKHLSPHFRIIAFDLPGFGLAQRPDADYSLDFFVHHLKGFIDFLNIKSVNLVGYSLGASIIVRYCARYPKNVDRVVLAAPGGFGRNTHFSMRLPSLPLIGSLLGKPTKVSTDLTLRLTIHDPSRITRRLIGTMNEHASIAGSWTSYLRTLRQGVGLCGVKGREAAAQAAATIDKPVRVIWGRQDRVFPLNHSDNLMSNLKRGDLTIFENCGHYPHWEYPQEFASSVTSHLKGSHP